MKKSELDKQLEELKRKNRWKSYHYEETSKGKFYFRVTRLRDDSEIYFDDYDQFVDFVINLNTIS